MTSNFFYLLSLIKTEGIGIKLLHQILHKFDDPALVFESKASRLKSISGIGPTVVKNILSKSGMLEAEKEIKWMQQYEIKGFSQLDEAYPHRLRECIDAPPILYYKGNEYKHYDKVLSIVGTRHATAYSDYFLEPFFEEISNVSGLCIVSGLAMGVDIKAHKLALKYNIPTIGVMGTGMQKIYPEAHRSTAIKMLENGGLLTEFHFNDPIIPGNFPRRNRIIAGMCDAVLVVETKTKGGSVITANIAHSYNREVFAVPGRTIDMHSAGCNFLIKTFRAAIATNAADLLTHMNWVPSVVSRNGMVQEFPFNNSDEQLVYQMIKLNPEIHIDALVLNAKLANGSLASLLLNLEMEGLIVAMPGKKYKAKL